MTRQLLGYSIASEKQMTSKLLFPCRMGLAFFIHTCASVGLQVTSIWAQACLSRWASTLTPTLEMSQAGGHSWTGRSSFGERRLA